MNLPLRIEYHRNRRYYFEIVHQTVVAAFFSALIVTSIMEYDRSLWLVAAVVTPINYLKFFLKYKKEISRVGRMTSILKIKTVFQYPSL